MINRKLTEQKVLNKLGIEDFRHITKEKVVDMATMWDKMDSEVAIKALEQFPDFSNTMKEMLSDYIVSVEQDRISNDDSVKSFHESCDLIIKSLQEELDKKDLSFEQKNFIFDSMITLVKMKSEKDSENKKYLIATQILKYSAYTTAVVGLIVAIGGYAKLDFNVLSELS